MATDKKGGGAKPDHGLGHLGDNLDEIDDLVDAPPPPRTQAPPAPLQSQSVEPEVGDEPGKIDIAGEDLDQPHACGLPIRMVQDRSEIIWYTGYWLKQPQWAKVKPTLQESTLYQVYRAATTVRPVTRRRFCAALRLYKKGVSTRRPKPLTIDVPAI